MRRVLLVAGVLVLRPRPAGGDPIQLRADALAATTAPAGLVTLAADAGLGANASAEAVVWTGAGAIGATADDVRAQVLVMALRAHTANGRAGVRVGRFVESLGALRPVQIDGGAALVRLPHRLDVEMFAGSPVAPATWLAGRAWDWIAGGRVARRVGDGGSIGLAVAEQRDEGRLAMEEVGLDAGAALGKRDDVAGKVAYDLANPGVAEVLATATHRTRALRIDLYGGYRAASHLLPATSLFSVLGDVPAERAGTTVTWRAAPRLDVVADVGVRRADAETAPALVLRARLRLDDKGTSSLGAELRRDGVGGDAWTGARGTARIALGAKLYASTELELVVPDRDRGRGAIWPWAIAALGRDDGTWQAAAAIEASASPEDRSRVDVLAQLGRRWGAP